MKKDRFSIASLMLVTALLLAGLSIYLNHQKKQQVNDRKSQLTQNSDEAPKANSKGTFKTLLQQRITKIESAQTPSITGVNQGETLLTRERHYTESELANMTQEQFVELLKDIEIRLPKISDIKAIPPGALHRTPPLVIEAGRNLGLIKEIITIHPNYEKIAVPFYKDCAKNDQGSTPVRALCLTNLIEIYKKNNKSFDTKEYPSQLLELTRLITDI